MNEEICQEEETIENENKLFHKGGPGGPGRPKLTEEAKLIKREVKELVKEHIEGLAEALPIIKPVLISKALTGDIPAIKEIHDRTMGKAIQPIAAEVHISATQWLKEQDDKETDN